ncbi:4347_t:CDS:10 [Entrophospora sp. SA101]|nr:4347_t:CDS:10 [Entrophospora sp. SA101]
MVYLHPNLAVAGLIQELLVYCPNKQYGCPTTICLDSYEHHFMHCKYRPADCQNAQWGCDFKGTIQNIKDHLENCIFEKFKNYIISNNDRIGKLENIIMEQQRELKKLQNIISKMTTSSSKGLNYLNGNGIDYDSVEEDDGSRKDDFPLGDVVCQKTISEHTCGVTSLAYNNELIYSGAHDGSTKIFKADTGQLLKNLHGHRMSVWALAAYPVNERFFSAGSDGTIKVWDWKDDRSNNCVDVLTQHSGKIYGLVINNNRLYSASSDKTVKVWDPTTLENLATFTGHQDGVNNLIAMDNNKLATAGSDHTVKIWDVNTGTCIKTISSHSSEVLDVASGDNLLFASTYEAVIHVYNLKDYSPVKTLSGHNWEVWQLVYTDGALFSASFDHTIKRWDVRNGLVCNATLKGHKGFVHAMTLGNHDLITGYLESNNKTKSGYGIVKRLWTTYQKDTPQSLKLIDAYLVYIMLSGIIQFVYCILAGTYPYNAFLAGFISTIGMSLRVQTNPKNINEFKGITPER